MAEAAILSKKTGKPIKLVWSREDDLKFDYYHAVAGMYHKAALDEKGKTTAWLHRSVFPSISSMNDASSMYGFFVEHGMGLNDMPFDIPNHRAENGPGEGACADRLAEKRGEYLPRVFGAEFRG